MRVLLFDHYLDGHHVGYASHIARHLLENKDAVTFVTLKDSPLLDGIRGSFPSINLRVLEASTYQIPKAPIDRYRQMTRTLKKVFQLADQDRVDVVHHLFLDGAEIPWAIAAPRLHPWKAFATLFWIHFDPHNLQSLRRRAAGSARRLAVRRLVGTGRLDGLMVHTERIKHRLGELFGSELLERCSVVPDPVPEGPYDDKATARRRLDLPANVPIVLFFGSLRREKGADQFLRTLPYLRGDYAAVVAGQPNTVSDSEIRVLASQLGKQSHIILRLGWIEEEDVPRYFAAADVVALPYRPTFLATSGILNRAVSAEKPVVVTDVGDVGEIVRRNGLGMVVPSGEIELFARALQQVMDDLDGVSSRVAGRARSYAYQHSAEVLAKRVRQAYISAGVGEGRPANES